MTGSIFNPGMHIPSKKRTKMQDRQVRPNSNRAQSVQPPAPPLVGVRDVALWIAISLATFLAYWPALRGGMVWDDDAHITSPALQSLHGLWRIWFDLGATHQYYPLLHSAFWIEHLLWGDAVLGYHLVNVTEHALAACLVVLIARRLALPGAWLAGLIFALHPVSVEAVAWISEQKSTLSAVFYLASALTYLHFDRTRRRSHYLWALGLFVLALLSKTVTATLPAALLVVSWWQRGRIEWRRDVRPLLPWFVLGASAGFFTAWVERTYIGAEGASYELTLVQHILLAGRILWFYAGKIVWPSNLIFSYPHWQVDPAVWWQYFYPLGVLTLVAGLLVLLRRPDGAARRAPLAGFLIFAGTLFPVLGFLHVFPFKYSYVADHFQYLASLGIMVPGACLLVGSMARIPSSKTASRALGVMLLAVLGVLTWRQSALYRDSETLDRAILARNPDSWMTHDNLGIALAQMPGRLTDAVAEFQAALRIYPDHARAHVNLGNAFSQMPGRLPDAIAEYQTALRLQPGLWQAHHNLGMALLQMPDRLPDAIAEFQATLRIHPSARAHMDLGYAWSQAGKLPEAIAEYQAALQLQPDDADAHNNLGDALAQVPGQLTDAISEYQTAIKIQPDNAEAHNSLGYALSQMPGRMDDAIAEFRAALRVQPDYVQARINLANVLSRMPGRRQEALTQYELALQAEPDLESVREAIKKLRAARR